MPDTLVDLTTPTPPIPFDASPRLAGLYRAVAAAETALEGSCEEPDGPLGEAYGAARDRFIEAPVDTVGDVLLKLEHLAYVEDLKAEPRLIKNRILLTLLRDLRATDAAHRVLAGRNIPGPVSAAASQVR